MQEEFASSDSVRSGRPLRHCRQAAFPDPLVLELGGKLEGVTLAYETWGRLNRERDNAVLVCHALSGDSHAARHSPEDDPGWWDAVVGPGKPIDTDKYFVICPNALGGCRGSTGPRSLNPGTGEPYGADFPTITIGDIVEAQKRLVDHLGIPGLRAAVGGSMGGQQVLTWATRFPERLERAVALATSPRLTMQAVAFDVIGRNAIIRDPGFRGGQYYGNGGPSVGLALARMLGHITYLSRQAMAEKFEAERLRPRDVPTEFERKFSVGSYLAFQGDKFVERFDANSYVALSLAMDLFDLGADRAELESRLKRSSCRWLVVSFSSDWLFPPEQSREIVRALLRLGKPVTYCEVASACGHDAFLLKNDLSAYGGLIRAVLERHPVSPAPAPGPEENSLPPGRTSIFHPQRLDYDRIADLIPAAASVLDLGCGSGTLLARLRARGCPKLAGVELDQEALLQASARGLDVVQADLNQGLSAFADGQFDYVILSQTLQAVRDVERVVCEMLRVGRSGVVSFPNFGYYKLRRMLSEQGRAPASRGLLRYNWYDTPNIRFFTIADFEDFCRERKIRVHRRIALDMEAGGEVSGDVNLLADMAIFVLSCR